VSLSLTALAAKVDTAWAKAGDAVVSMTLHAIASAPTYDPSTGAVGSATTEYPVQVVRDPQKAKQVAQNAVMGVDDVVEVFIVRNSELPANPKAGDYFMEGSVKHPVRSVIGDGVGVVTSFVVG